MKLLLVGVMACLGVGGCASQETDDPDGVKQTSRSNTSTSKQQDATQARAASTDGEDAAHDERDAGGDAEDVLEQRRAVADRVMRSGLAVLLRELGRRQIATEFVEQALVAPAVMDEVVWALNLRDPRVFALRSKKEITPRTTKKFLTRDALPTLHALLDDPVYEKHWSKIAMIICYLGDDAKSASVVIEYLRRPAPNPPPRRWEPLRTLKLLGFIGGEEAERFLMKAMTRDGARELANAWYGESVLKLAREPRMTEAIAGQAALGLIHTQSREGIDAVESFYDAALNERWRRGHGFRLFSELASAMAARDLIEDEGMARYAEYWPGGTNYSIERRGVKYLTLTKGEWLVEKVGRNVNW